MNPNGFDETTLVYKTRRKKYVRQPKPDQATLTTRMPKDLYALLKTAAKTQGISMNRLAILWFEDGIRAQTKMGSDNG